jgi:phosphate acetyltransferase
MKRKALFVAATGQHIGKTTTCLGLVAGLQKRYAHVGFMKPVGQEHVETDSGLHVDKDVVLFKEYFHLKSPEEWMSPVLFPRGFTRDYLDGKIDHPAMVDKIFRAFRAIADHHDVTVVEGTGHCGVGSIVNLNNAQAAALLRLPIIIVASGGLGSAFDELALNWVLCEQAGAKVAGVILNRVLPDKRDMIESYMSKALEKWEIPLLGCIPYDAFLSNPSMKDFESLFETSLLSGEEHYLRHFRTTRLVATSVENFLELIGPNQLIITPANREDIILATLTKYWDVKIADPCADLETGMILTGDHPPRQALVEQIKRAHIPMLYAPVGSYTAMKMITSFTAKIRKEDTEKIKEAVTLVEQHVDFERLTTILENS